MLAQAVVESFRAANHGGNGPFSACFSENGRASCAIKSPQYRNEIPAVVQSIIQAPLAEFVQLQLVSPIVSNGFQDPVFLCAGSLSEVPL